MRPASGQPEAALNISCNAASTIETVIAVPRPVCARCISAARIAKAVDWPVAMSTMGPPIFIGGAAGSSPCSSSEPVW